jgi:hypothetical protein
MFDFQTIKLMHRHSNGEWAPMSESGHHDSAEHDPERAWLRGARIFQCTRCEDAIAIAAPSAPPSEPPGADS